MEGGQIRFQAADPSDKVLRRDEYLMPIRLNYKQLRDETVKLYNMFCRDDAFISEHDQRNFELLFDGVLEKLKFYYENNPRGYGKLAGMEIVKVLEWVQGTEGLVEKVKRVMRN
jgi:hypothetical protein